MNHYAPLQSHIFWFVCFWHCNLIIFLPFFFSLQTLPYIPPRSLSNLWSPYSLIIIACIYVISHTYLFLNITFSAHVLLLVCVFLGLTIWNCTNQWLALPQKSTSPAPHCPQLPVILCVGLRPHGLCPVHFSMSTGIILVQCVFGQSWEWDFIGVVFAIGDGNVVHIHYQVLVICTEKWNDELCR